MFDILAELIFYSLFEGLCLSSSMSSSKKVKVWHAIFRTIFYLLATGLFIFLSLGSTGGEKLTYVLIGITFFGAMIKTNWTSYKRHKEWLIIQQNVNKLKPKEKVLIELRMS